MTDETKQSIGFYILVVAGVVQVLGVFLLAVILAYLAITTP